MIEFISYNSLYNEINKTIYNFRTKFDLIISIQSSGLIVGSYLSLKLNIPHTDIENYILKKIFFTGSTRKRFFNFSDIKNVLLVDDSISSGKSLNSNLEKIKPYIKEFKHNLEVFVPITSRNTTKMIDYYSLICPRPRIFEWNLFHHKEIENIYFDLDGVFCPDPSKKENDDGINYLNFIKNTECIIRPLYKIGGIVTSRLEKYRSETENWLKKNNISYDKLFMLENYSAIERKKKKIHGVYKANIYKNSKANLFIESSDQQALTINQISKKPVYCNTSGKFYSDNRVLDLKKNFNFFKKLILKFLY